MAEKKSKPKTKTNPKKTATGKANPKKGKPDPIEELKNNLSQEQDKYLRLFAEFENFKKRTSRERIELFKTAGQEVISSLLPILDDFERAVNNTPEEQNKEIEGFVLIQNKLNDIMKSNGLIATETKIGDTFDAEVHEAITLIPAPDATQKGKIIDITEKGYQLGDKIIRFPKVVVGQ
ncbi:MAG: nucleotide exchange factor GrpE [Flavobacteriaceae bacterium]|jgi:molecular chaperone GrpE|nr:nucleotide exchange factor GrpE [Flavobacteriaceae bacterium]MDG1968595.1 nucleotide exchange factor GrpE [Flavobacteriaceae bacterium]|tara:strand:- start:535 stop:1068 length:534 start_codon:yes stop_codon:yes gene_type:complete